MGVLSMKYEYDSDNIFAKILREEIPNKTVIETKLSLAFEDINPQAPTHILIIPKKHIAKLSDADISDQKLLGHMLIKANEIAANLKLDNTFRLVINNGANAGQSVFHLHMHLLSGRSFSWPPG